MLCTIATASSANLQTTSFSKQFFLFSLKFAVVAWCIGIFPNYINYEKFIPCDSCRDSKQKYCNIFYSLSPPYFSREVRE